MRHVQFETLTLPCTPNLTLLGLLFGSPRFNIFCVDIFPPTHLRRNQPPACCQRPFACIHLGGIQGDRATDDRPNVVATPAHHPVLCSDSHGRGDIVVFRPDLVRLLMCCAGTRCGSPAGAGCHGGRSTRELTFCGRRRCSNTTALLLHYRSLDSTTAAGCAHAAAGCEHTECTVCRERARAGVQRAARCEGGGEELDLVTLPLPQQLRHP